MKPSLALACSLYLTLSWITVVCLAKQEVSDPCKTQTYKELSEPERTAAFETIGEPHSDENDFMEVAAWYRFSGRAGNRMAKRCVPEMRCGSEVGGWLSGPHPSVEDGTVNGTVCFKSGHDCCYWRSEVKVRNCGDFYLYYLKREVRGAYSRYRYCGNGEGPDPCDERFYNLLQDVDRAKGYITDTKEDCDRRKEDEPTYNRWNRFSGPAGVAMPTECVDTMRCGAEAPGWLCDEHPEVDEGVVTRQVCYHWNGDCCYYKNDIKVKNCGDYFVYKFEKPPAHYLRYCGDGTGNGQCKRRIEKENPCVTGDYIELSDPDRAAGYTETYYPKCDYDDLVKEEAWYRFTGKAGTRMAKKCVPINHCGTGATGWLNGSLPESEDEGAVNGTVCFNWKNDCCYWETQVKVRNCGHFYLFLLKRDHSKGKCDFRYCGNGGGPKPTQVPNTTATTKATTKATTETTKNTEPSVPTISPKPPHPPIPRDVNLTCEKNEMWISIPKNLLHGLDREHLRLSDVKCGAKETQTHFILHTKLTECQTLSRHTNNFISYTNKVLEIPVGPNQIITRVREVEIPFSCYYSKMGVVSAVGLQVKSRKIVFSEKGFGKFALEMKLFPDNRFWGYYKRKDFPLYVPLRKDLFVEVSVDTEDTRLAILAEECFATPDPDPNKPGLKYVFIKDGCKKDETVRFISTVETTIQRFSLETFKFLGDHQFVYLHCKVKICNATDPLSRCAQGCLQERHKRSLESKGSRDEEFSLAQGPIMRKDEDEQRTVDDSIERLRSANTNGQQNASENGPAILASAVAGAICLMGVSYLLWSSKKSGNSHARKYIPLDQPKLE